MSIERSIVRRLFESRGINESEFTSGSSTYKCVFGKYYRDGEEITREEYFRAQGVDSSDSNTSDKSIGTSYERYSPEELDTELENYEKKVEKYLDDMRDLDYDDRDDILEKLGNIKKNLRKMEDYLSDEQFERSEELVDKIFSANDILYHETEEDDGSDAAYDEYRDSRFD